MKTSHDKAMELEEAATKNDRQNMFRQNSGKKGRTFPDYNPYTIQRCVDCDVNSGKGRLAFVPENEVCAACKVVRKCAWAERNAKCGAKAVRNDPKVKALQGTYIKNNNFPHDVLISRTSIREWTNQPHEQYYTKNRMLKDIKKIFLDLEYLGPTEYHKSKNVEFSHIFEINIGTKKSWIIVREYDTHEFILHSISDNLDIIL